MAVTKASNSGIKTGVLKYDSMLAGNAAYDPAATWLIQRTSPTSGSSVTFSSIPSTYTSLQLRVLAKLSADDYMCIQLNGDTGNNYALHALTGNGSTASAGAATALNYLNIYGSGNVGQGFTQPIVSISDFHNYASTTQNKTHRAIIGCDRNTTNGEINLVSGLWLNTNAINSIRVFQYSGATFASGTTIALYGMKG